MTSTARLPENPLSSLLAMRESREPVFGWTLGWLLQMLACLGLCFAYTATGVDGVRVYSLAMTGLLLVLLPMFRALGDGAALTSMRRGRCFEEILGTRLEAPEVVDGLARHAIWRTMQAALPLWSVLLGSAWLFESSPMLLLPAALLWLPLLVYLAAFEAYAVLALSTLAGPGGRGLPFQAAAALAVAAPLSVLASWGWTLARMLEGTRPEALLGGVYGPAATFLTVGLTLALALAAARGAALLALERGDGWLRAVGALVRRVKGRRRAVARGPSNPLAFREWARQRGRLNAGALLVLAPLVLVLTGDLHLEVLHSLLLPAGVLLIAIQTVRAAMATVGTVVDERESGTLAFVALTRVTPRDFLDGSAQSAWIPLAVENTLALPLLLAVAASDRALVLVTVELRDPCPILAFLLGVALLYAGPWMGTYLGLASSAGSFRRGEARGHALTWLVLLGIAAFALGALIYGLLVPDGGGGLWSLSALTFGLTIAAVPLLGTTLLGALGFRLTALRDLSTDGLEGLGLPGWLVALYRRSD